MAAASSRSDRVRHCRVHGKEAVDTTGNLVLPGLVNTHGHAPMVLYRGLADDLSLMDWLQRYIFPAEARTVSPAMVRGAPASPRWR